MFTIAVALTFPVACSTGKAVADTPENPAVEVSEATGSAAMPSQAVMPKAVIYRTSGDYNMNVPVTLNESGTALVSYPAPSDVAHGQTPIPLADGYLLDRRGIGRNTAFTSYTYSEYAALKAAPSPQELMKSIIPGARVTEAVRLPMTATTAEADTAAVNAMIRGGLKNCTVVFKNATIVMPGK